MKLRGGAGTRRAGKGVIEDYPSVTPPSVFGTSWGDGKNRLELLNIFFNDMPIYSPT